MALFSTAGLGSLHGWCVLEVSVVIPVCNTAMTIDQCVASLLRMDYPSLQVIFADDGSTDGTGTILQTYAEEHTEIELLSQEHRGLAAARNLGLAHARGEIVCYTDGDCEVPSDWLARMAAHFSAPDAAPLGVVGGSQEALPPHNIYTEFNQRRRIAVYGTRRKLVAAVPGCNFAVRRDVLEKIGGFDESFARSAEEYDMCYRVDRLGYEILYDPDICVWHHHPRTVKNTLKKSFLHGHEWMRLRRKHPRQTTKPALSLYRQIVSSPPARAQDMLMLLALAVLYSLGTLYGNLVGLWKYR
jgi:GT2 family glycosyltransferase